MTTTSVKTKVQISETELLTLLMSVIRPTFVGILYKVMVRMNKIGNPYFERVFKTTKGTFFIGGTYESMVREREKKEGMVPSFESMECSVGTHVEGTKCVQYNDKLNRYYLQYFTFETSNLKTIYECDGEIIDREMFREYEVKKSTTSRQPQENKHIVQSLMLSSIQEITLNGTTYEVVR